MTSAHLQQWIQHPETLDRDTLYELRTLVTRYPYFQSLRLLYLKNLYLLHDINFGAELRKAVLYAADRRALFHLIEGDRYTLKCQETPSLSSQAMEEEPGMDRTLSLIEAFLATVPEECSRNMELDYAMDYTAYLLRNEEAAGQSEVHADNETAASELRGHELIDGFLLKNGAMDMPPLEVKALPAVEKETSDEETEISKIEEEPAGEGTKYRAMPSNEEPDNSCFTETLAKIYIKQRRYDKALEIIKKLSLNYPKKNAYFADQIRFLEKLIINAKSK